MLMPGETPEEMQRPERVHDLLAAWVSPGDVEIIRSAVYSFHALLARRWRDRRAFLVGDSAHQMPPFLGQGMCSGIRDAANLVWKLALVRRGLAGDALLDTYEIERAPHVRTIVKRAVGFGQIIQTTDPAVAAARDAQFLENPSSALDPKGSRMPGLLGGVLHRDGDDDPAGELFPQSRMRTKAGEERLLDDVLGPGFAFVGRDDPRALLSPSSRAFLESLGTRCVALGDGLVEEPGGFVGTWLARHGAALVRPDRYVFGVARDVASSERLTSALRAWVTGR
jgi:3-(3-hydroxy-phenyl)propionate hydroxylase